MKGYDYLKLLAVLAVAVLVSGQAGAATLSVPGSYGTIQAAIDAAQPGDTVSVAAGVYQESLGGWRDLQVLKSVSIVGAGSGSTIVELSGLQHGVEIRGTGLDVQIQGITFTKRAGNEYSAGWPIVVGEVASTFNSLVFRDVEIAYGEARNLWLDGGSTFNNVVIDGCNIHHSGAWGMSVRGTVNGLTIMDSYFEYNGTYGSQADPSHGIGLDLVDLPGSATNVTVTGGSFSNNGRKGVNLLESSNVLFDGSTFNSNGEAGACIWVWSGVTSDITFSHCTLSNNGLDGIVFGAETGCTISNVDVEDCVMSGNQRAGVFSYWEDGWCNGTITGISVSGCNITGNTAGVVNFAPESIAAEVNWWGAPDGPGPVGPGSGDTVSSGVDYDPWLTEPAQLNTLALLASYEDLFVQPGENVTIALAQFGLAQEVTGYQAFLSFDTAMMSFASGSYTAIPYDMEMLPAVADGANIDLARGSIAETSANADLAYLVFTAGATDGTTQVVFRSHDPATMFTDSLGNGIGAYLMNGPWITIDGTPPTGVSIAAQPADWTNDADVLITFSATDATSGIDHYELSIDGGAFFPATNPYTATVGEGVHTAEVKAIDRAGNFATASTNFYIDRTDPVIAIDSAKQDEIELIGGPNAVQGTVDIYVTATDVLAGLGENPYVTVTPDGGSAAEVATFVDVSGDTFHYTWTVTASTPNGPATINAMISDLAGNTADAVAQTINVNKHQAVIDLELEMVAVNVDRWITFTFGGDGGTVGPYTIDQLVSFTAGSGTAVITDLPTNAVWTKVSVKDQQHTLRRTLDLNGGTNGQYSASFIGDANLLGGDLTNDNIVDIRDFGVLSGQFGTTSLLDTQWPTRDANISCDKFVDTNDFSYIHINFMEPGDALPGNAMEPTLSIMSSGNNGNGKGKKATGPQEGVAMDSITVKELAKLIGMKDAKKADLNGDKVVDCTDIGLFIDQYIGIQR